MYDILIKNGKTIAGKVLELAITDGKIVKVSKLINAQARQVIDASNLYFSAGWIDDHVHCYEKMKLYFDTPDQIGVATGVTTVIDAGTTGAENIGDFYQLAMQAKTNVYALLNISKSGIVTQDELSDLTNVQAQLIRQALLKYPDFIVGIKVRMSKTVIGENGIKPLDLAKAIQHENNNLPLMVHIGSSPPELQEILARMESGDVLTHCFNGKVNGILDRSNGKIKDFVWDAYQRGIIFDIGHGTDSFNFEVADIALQSGMKAASISTDIYHRNRKNGPVYDLATTMEKCQTLGYTWEEIIERVTSVPAKNFHLTTKGQLEVGFDADITLFTFEEAEKVLRDANGNTRVIKTAIKAVKTIIGGVVYDN
ncbi:MAG: amidohydrolase/deacetylase family metallohydrolase [Streptococcaceae bacterium]|jgi:dihydroorotase|nr:amidohydrolase/deacetylase family metallohydrolase [Streptococcaceae bacterium]